MICCDLTAAASHRPTTSSFAPYRSQKPLAVSHSLCNSSFSAKITLGSPVRLYTPSRRLAVATNFCGLRTTARAVPTVQYIFQFDSNRKQPYFRKFPRQEQAPALHCGIFNLPLILFQINIAVVAHLYALLAKQVNLHIHSTEHKRF